MFYDFGNYNGYLFQQIGVFSLQYIGKAVGGEAVRDGVEWVRPQALWWWEGGWNAEHTEGFHATFKICKMIIPFIY